jgi:hypothetical protein
MMRMGHFVVAAFLFSTGCGKREATQSGASPSAASDSSAVVAQAQTTKREAAPEPANVGVTLEAFVAAWNTKSYSLGAAAKRLSINTNDVNMTHGGKMNIEFVPDLELTATSAPSGQVQDVTLRNGRSDMAATILGRFAFSCLVAATSPGTDEMALIKELGMAAGTTTKAVRSKATFGFSQEKGGPEIITVRPPADATAGSP